VSLSGIAAFVAGQRQRYAQARAERERRDQLVFSHPIEPHLGTVAVDQWGALIEVRLDRNGLRVADPARVAERILHAIHAAEAAAARAMAEHSRRAG
jgi:hypothetical protein